MTTTLALWVFLGAIIGALVTLIILAICMHIDDETVDKEEFVKKLIKKEGWEKSYEILTFEFKGKYLKIWRKLYIKHM